jgi:hypothetical protein
MQASTASSVLQKLSLHCYNCAGTMFDPLIVTRGRLYRVGTNAMKSI